MTVFGCFWVLITSLACTVHSTLVQGTLHACTNRQLPIWNNFFWQFEFHVGTESTF